MRRNNFWIGAITAIVTVVSLNLIFAGSNWANERRFGYNHWRHRYHHCDDYYRNNDRAGEFDRSGRDTTDF